MSIENNRMTVMDENGEEMEVEILLTFDYQNKSYVLFTEVNDEENVLAFTYDEDGNLSAIETEEEWEFCEEVLNAFMDEESGDNDE